MWYPFKFYKNLCHVSVAVELGGSAGWSRSHARAYRKALRKGAMPAAVIAGITEVDMRLVGWSTTVLHEFDCYILRINAGDGPVFVQTSSGLDSMGLLSERSLLTGWRTSVEGWNVVVARPGASPPEPVALEIREIPSLLNQGSV